MAIERTRLSLVNGSRNMSLMKVAQLQMKKRYDLLQKLEMLMSLTLRRILFI